MTKGTILRLAEFASFPQGRELLRLVMDNAPIGLSLVAPDGRVVYVNQAYADMFGRSREAALGLTAAEIVAPEMIVESQAQLAAVFSGEIDSFRAERRYMRADGSRFWVLVSASAVRQEGDARPAFVIGQIVDIDREKRAEAAVAEAESRWNFALESAGQGVWDHDLRTGLSFFSRTWKRMRGLDPDAPFAYSEAAWLARVHPDDRDFARRQEHLLTSGEADHHEFEYRERLDDGRMIWVLSRGRAVAWNPDGSVARVIGTDTDVTRIKSAEIQLAAVIGTMADAVVLFDTGERLVYCNPQYSALFPKTPHVRVPGARLADILAASVAAGEPRGYGAANGAEYIERTRAALRSGGDWELELADGRWLHARARIVADGGGYLSVISDVTARKRAELDQAALNRRLAELADRDGLTGLTNRRAFDEALAADFARSAGDGTRLALLLFDVDHFKAFNDAYGHPQGDACLKALAGVLTAASRCRGCRAARIGGEEFALILPDTDMAEAGAVADAVRRHVAALAIRHERSPTGRLTVSGGIAVTGEPEAADSARALIARADQALYGAKAAGRDRVVTWTAGEETAGGDPPAVDTPPSFEI